MCKRVALSVLAFTLAMVLLATTALGSQAQPLPDNGGRVDGIYVWSNETGMPEDRQGLVDACTAPAHPLGIVLHSNYQAGGYLSMWPAADLHAFNALAHQAGISVYALYTNKFWIPKVVQYNSECSGVEQHFDGYAMDYEGPEGSYGWEPSTASDIQYYADAEAACGALPLHVSIGWHWDNEILYNGQAKPAYEHILDLVDSVDVQTAYETAAQIEVRAQEEVAYGAGLIKPVFLTIETQDVSALGMSEWNTFYEEGQDAMWAELAQVNFGGPTFAGFMLHYYEHAYASGAALWPLPDQCPEDPNKTAPGVCGCGVADTDSDGDGTADCIDQCPNDPNKVAPGTCGCGVADTDTCVVLTWLRRADMPTPRTGFGAATASNGRIYAVGGWDGDGSIILDKVEEYDPVADLWASRTSLPEAQPALGVVAAANGRIYAIGGEINGVALKRVLEYDPATDQAWVARRDMDVKRAWPGVAATSDGQIYVIGGWLTHDTPTGTVEKYDPATNTWTPCQDMPTPRWDLGAVAASNGLIYAIGGTQGGGSELPTVEAYDPATNEWTSCEDLKVGGEGLGAVLATNGKIYAIGRYDYPDSALGTVEEYDPATGHWTLLAGTNTMPTARWSLGAAVSNGRIYIIGGNSPGGKLQTVEEATFTGPSITGRVQDSSGHGMAGVSISASWGANAITNADGYYTIAGLTAGTYVVTPAKSGYTFTPASRSVTVPASATGQDFTGALADSTPPLLVDVPGDMAVQATSADGANVSYVTPTATDDVDPSPTVSCAPASGALFPLGTTTVSCTATDAAGNASSAAFQVTVVPATVFVRLLDSQGNGLAGGTAQYYEGGWKTIPGSTDSDGWLITDIPKTKGNLTFRITYASASKDRAQNVGADPTVVFQTQRVEVQLKDSTGALIDAGAVQYYAGGWRTFGAGSTAGGVANMELLPNSYTFAMTYAYARNEKAQNVGDDPTVVFQTKRVEVQLQDSAGALIDAGAVQYYAGGWRTFGAGSTAGGVANMELLPNSYTFAMTYAFGRNQKAQNVGADPTVVFQTQRVEVQLQDSTGALIDAGAVQYYAGAWRTFGSGSTAVGVASMELLPNSYTFAMTYAYARNEKAQNVGLDPTVVFQTKLVEVQLKDSAGALIDAGAVQYYAGGWRTFGAGSTAGGVASMELLPNSYTFAMTYAYARNEKAQNVGADPVVVFQTKLVEVQLQDSTGALIDTGAVQYYAGGWRTFGAGSTAGGVANMELLPNSYTFAMTYAYGRNEKAQNVGADPVVVFQTKLVEVQLKDSAGALIDAGAVQYYAGGWRTFGAGSTSGGVVSMELLPNSYTFAMTYAYARNEKAQNVGADPVVVFQTKLVEVQLRDSAGALIDTGAVQYYAGGWRTFGAGSTAGGVANMELLPNSYTFAMTYAYARNQKAQSVGDDPAVVFQTGQVYSLSGTCTHYYAGAWRLFTQGMELLPNAYTFRFSGMPDVPYTISQGVANPIQ